MEGGCPPPLEYSPTDAVQRKDYFHYNCWKSLKENYFPTCRIKTELGAGTKIPREELKKVLIRI